MIDPKGTDPSGGPGPVDALRASEARLRSILRAAPIGVGVTVDRLLMEANPRLCEILGYPAEEIVGRSARFLYPSDEEFERVGREKYAQIREHGTGTVETRWVRKDGTVIDVLLSSTLIDPDDSSAGVTFTALDITERKRSERAVLDAERMSTMGAITAAVAHEVRNPLFVISTNVDALEVVLGARVETRAQVLLQAIRGGVDRLGRLMADLLDYGRPPALEMADTDVHVAVEGAVRTCADLATRVGVEVLLVSSREPAVASIDVRRIEQVVANLLENAIQHSPRGGSVRVEVERFRCGTGEWVRCRVEDSGPGFRPEDLPHTFEPFHSRRRGGTGLGLSIAQRIVDRHGGRLTVANRADDGGAAVTVDLPCAPGGD